MIEKVYIRFKYLDGGDGWSAFCACSIEQLCSCRPCFEPCGKAMLFEVYAAEKSSSEHVTFHLRKNGVCTVYDCTDIELLNAFWTRLIN